MKTAVRILLALCLALVLCCSAFAETVSVNGAEYTPRQNLFTCLFLGIDQTGPLEEGTGDCDTIALLVIDKAADTYAVLMLDRDTYCGAGASIADFYKTGADETETAISELLSGITIDCYAAADMAIVGVVNDEVGGVTVTIGSDLTAIDPAMVEGATLCLTNDQALAFVRGTVTDNRERMQRQQQFLTAARPYIKAACEADPSYFVALAERAKEDIDTDMTDKDLCYLAKALRQNTALGFFTPEGTFEDGFFTPEDADLTRIVTELFYLPAE